MMLVNAGSGYTDPPQPPNVVYTQAQSQAVVNAIHPPFWYSYKQTANGVVMPGAGRFIPFFAFPADCTGAAVDAAVIEAGPGGYIMMYGEIDLLPYNPAFTINDLATAWLFVANRASVVAAGIKLISPTLGSTISAGDRLDQFFDAVRANPPYAMRVDTFDGNPAHSDANLIATIYGRVQTTAAKYPGYPIVVSEWGFAAAGTTDPEVTNCMNVLIPIFENDPRIVMHGWWYGGPISASAAAPYNPGSLQLADDSGVLTVPGTHYALFT